MTAAQAERTILAGYDGPTHRGGPEVLADAHEDITRGLLWGGRGFTVLGLPGGIATQKRLLRGVDGWVRSALTAAGLGPPPGRGLGAYHRVPGLTDGAHAQVARWGVPFAAFGVARELLEAWVGEVVGRPVSLLLLPDARGTPTFAGLRVIRPRQADHNPFHRDGWLDCYRRTVNLWIPLANCGRGSSLRLFAGSHLWPESDLLRTPAGLSFGGRTFTVPALVALARPDEPEQPTPELGEALMFSSFLLHGGARNTHPDQTRISCEFRFTPREDAR